MIAFINPLLKGITVQPTVHKLTNTVKPRKRERPLSCGYSDTARYRLYHDSCSVLHTVMLAGGQKTCQLSAQMINNGAQGQGRDLGRGFIRTAGGEACHIRKTNKKPKKKLWEKTDPFIKDITIADP